LSDTNRGRPCNRKCRTIFDTWFSSIWNWYRIPIFRELFRRPKNSSTGVGLGIRWYSRNWKGQHRERRSGRYWRRRRLLLSLFSLRWWQQQRLCMLKLFEIALPQRILPATPSSTSFTIWWTTRNRRGRLPPTRMAEVQCAESGRLFTVGSRNQCGLNKLCDDAAVTCRFNMSS